MFDSSSMKKNAKSNQAFYLCLISINSVQPVSGILHMECTCIIRYLVVPQTSEKRILTSSIYLHIKLLGELYLLTLCRLMIVGICIYYMAVNNIMAMCVLSSEFCIMKMIDSMCIIYVYIFDGILLVHITPVYCIN